MSGVLQLKPILNLRVEESIDLPDGFRVLEKDEPQTGDRCWRILSHSGDDRIVWDSGSLADISGALKLFKQMIDKGLKPFRVDASGKRSPEEMKTFDPHAEEVVFVPMPVAVGG